MAQTVPEAHKIPAIRGDTTSRIVIVPDITTFWPGKTPNWSVLPVAEVMKWTNIFGAQIGIPVLVVASPGLGFEQYTTGNFERAWRIWAQSHSACQTPVALTIRHELPTIRYTRLGFQAGHPVMVHFVPKEFFDRFDTEAEAWKAILDDALGPNLNIPPSFRRVEDLLTTKLDYSHATEAIVVRNQGENLEAHAFQLSVR